MNDMMIAHATDLHLRADPSDANLVRFERLLDHLLTLDPLPDALILSGDLADDGDPQAYRHLRQALERWPAALLLTVGNHDDRSALFEVFPQSRDGNGFAQAAFGLRTWRVILIDTLEPGRAGGGFDQGRAYWLRTELARQAEMPALIVLHHPPADIGLPWIDPGRPPWAKLLAETVAPFKVAGFAAGHVHVGVSTMWQGHRLVTAPAVASDLSLMFAPMAGVAPDGRPLVERGQVGFALHRWADGNLFTYFGRCPYLVMERWDETTRSTVASVMAEKMD